MKRKILVFFVVMLLIATSPQIHRVVSESNLKELSISPGNHFKLMSFDGRIRSYRLHIPPSYNCSKPMPIVFMFHGAPSNSIQIKIVTEFNEKADKEGFIVVYPNGITEISYILKSIEWNGISFVLRPGISRYWNSWDFIDSNVDDVGFIRTLIGHLQTTLNIKSSRIYVTGQSAGGFMTYRLGAELSDIIAAICPVAGSIGGRWSNKELWFSSDVPLYVIPEPEHSLPVIVFHGMADKAILYDGRIDNDSNTLLMSVNKSIAFWVEHNCCNSIPQINVSESGNIITRVYTNGSQDTEVILYTVVDGGHGWFGSKYYPPCEISINDLMWEFFEKHPKR